MFRLYIYDCFEICNGFPQTAQIVGFFFFYKYNLTKEAL